MFELIKAYGPRLAYSAVLLALIIVLFREVAQVWTDRRIYMGDFEYLVDEPVAGAGASFAAKVQNQQRVLAYMLGEERARREAELKRQESLKDTEIGNSLPPAPDMLPNAKSSLDGLELRVQGFDIGALMAKLRGWISPRREVSGAVEQQDGAIVPSVSWPLAFDTPEPATTQFFRGTPETTETAAAYQVAAAILWAQAISPPRRKAAETPFATRDDFVAWARAWRLYRQVRTARQAGDATDQSPTILRALAILEPYRTRPDVYPEVLRLYADLTALAGPGYTPPQPVDTAALVDRYVKAAQATQAPATPAPVNVVAARTARAATAAAAADQPVVRPGVLLWDADGRSAVTVGAILQAPDGANYALIPAYMLSVSAREEFPLVLGRGGPPVATVRKSDVITVPGDTHGGLALARLHKDVTATNELAGGGRVASFGQLPAVGATLQIRTVHGPSDVKVAALEPALIRVTPVVTQPGDGGAPVLDSAGRLVAFAYVKGGFLPAASLADRFTLAGARRRAAAEPAASR